MKNLKPVCKWCGSSDIIANGNVQWCNKSQSWSIVKDIFEDYDCLVCDGETSVIFIENKKA